MEKKEPKSKCCEMCSQWHGVGNCLDNNCICHSPTPPASSEANFLQVGRTLACGHCDERFIEGLKQAEEVGYFKNHKCDCICHDSASSGRTHIRTSLTYCLPSGIKDFEWEVIINNVESLLEEALADQKKKIVEKLEEAKQNFETQDFIKALQDIITNL